MQFVVWNDKWDDRMAREFPKTDCADLWVTTMLLSESNSFYIVDLDTVRARLSKLPKKADLPSRFALSGENAVSVEDLIKVFKQHRG